MMKILWKNFLQEFSSCTYYLFHFQSWFTEIIIIIIIIIIIKEDVSFTNELNLYTTLISCACHMQVI